ncbi:MAG: type III pantothenate kinase, partial [Chitinophagaceae bacterium]
MPVRLRKTLCIDFGNTRQKAALFENDQLLEVRYFGNDLLADMKQLIQEWQPACSILSSVINHDAAIEKLLKEHTALHV